MTDHESRTNVDINDAYFDAAEKAMRTTATLDDEVVGTAAELTGVKEIPALLRLGLTTLIQVESAKRLAALGGTDPLAQAAPRHRDDLR